MSGHLQVIADDAAHDLALFGIEVEAGEEAFRELDALAAQWSPVRRALPVSCMQQREEEEIEAVDFRQQRGETLFPVMAGWRSACTLSMTRKVCSSTV